MHSWLLQAGGLPTQHWPLIFDSTGKENVELKKKTANEKRTKLEKTRVKSKQIAFCEQLRLPREQ